MSDPFNNPVCTIHQLRAVTELLAQLGITSINHDFCSKMKGNNDDK